ncbi:MAG: BON domain-containing protein [Acidimicrobiales bacterium]|nr:BON domain-containing protein [Acidimicrobiales bacterium]
MFLIRILLLPFRLALRLLGVSVRLGYRVGRAPVMVSSRAARLMGWKGTILFGSGLVLGLLIAPWPGRQLRDRLRDVFTRRGLSDDELAEKVAFELSHSPRTWHLPQPSLNVLGGRVILKGEVPHVEGRAELERVAACVPGVLDVDNQLIVATTESPGPAGTREVPTTGEGDQAGDHLRRDDRPGESLTDGARPGSRNGDAGADADA